MSTERTVPTVFGPETRFEIRPSPPGPFRVVQENRFEELKNRLLRERLSRAAEPGWESLLRRAANEAAALAWVTPYPLLVFPDLFAEKAESAVRVALKQARTFRQTRKLLLVA